MLELSAQKPEVSVLMTTFNRAALLPRSLNSLFEQQGVSFELIVLDDGSTDETFVVADGYLQKHPDKVRYTKHSNRKPPLSLNAGIALAQGQYITFLDSDDEYLPNHLALRLQFMKTNPTIDLIYGGLDIVGNAFVPDKDDPSKQVHLGECVTCGTLFGKREVFWDLGGFQNLPYASDADFVSRAIAYPFQVGLVHYPTYRYYRDTPDGICNTLEASQKAAN